MCTRSCVHVNIDAIVVMGTISICSTPDVLRQRLSLNLDSQASTGWPGSSRDPPVSAFPEAGLHTCTTAPGCHIHTGDLNSGPCACMENTLMINPQSLSKHFIIAPVDSYR